MKPHSHITRINHNFDLQNLFFRYVSCIRIMTSYVITQLKDKTQNPNTIGNQGFELSNRMCCLLPSSHV